MELVVFSLNYSSWSVRAWLALDHAGAAFKVRHIGGFVDEGWRDTVLVMPGESVQVLAQFTEPGTFLYHCHNLEHEDMGMMRNFKIE